MNSLKQIIRHITSVTLVLTLSLAACATLTACGDKSKDEPEPPVKKDTRSVLVYMVADNNLGDTSTDFDQKDIDEMVQAAQLGSIPQDCRLILYHVDHFSQPALYEITAQSTTPVKIKTYDYDTSSASALRMRQVLADFKAEAPATNYGMVLWSHASGWLQDGMAEKAAPTSDKQPLSFGVSGGERMNITTLAQVLNGQKMEFLYFDCCYMASVEALYELRHVTDRIVASAAELPSNGSPWEMNVECLFAKGKADLEAAAKNTFNLYNGKSGRERTCTFSVINTAGLDRLATAMRNIFQAATSPIPSDDYAQQKLSKAVPCYYYDLGQYAASMADGMPAKYMVDFNAALAETVIYAAATPRLFDELAVEHHSGLSINILRQPEDAEIKNYNQLSWYNDIAKSLFK